MEIEILYIIIGRVAKHRFDSFYYQCNALIFYNIYRYNISNRVFSANSNSQQSPFEQNSIKKATIDPRVIKGGRLKISIDTVS